MLRRWSTILALLAVATLLWWLSGQWALPPGVEAKGSDEGVVSWVALAASVASLLSALVGLVIKILELRQKRA